MAKYKTIYKAILELSVYSIKNEETKNLSFMDFDQDYNLIIDDLNKKLVNMDCLGTNISVDIEQIDLNTIFDSYNEYDLISNIEIPSLVTIEINPVKVSEEEIKGFLEGIIDIIKSKKSDVMAVNYEQSKNNKLKITTNKDNIIIVELNVKKMKEQ